MAVVSVHAQFGFVVGSPEPESDKPGMQQPRVVGVLDVFLHQLPVARNTLAVVTQQGELSTIEEQFLVKELQIH